MLKSFRNLKVLKMNETKELEKLKANEGIESVKVDGSKILSISSYRRKVPELLLRRNNAADYTSVTVNGVPISASDIEKLKLGNINLQNGDIIEVLDGALSGAVFNIIVGEPVKQRLKNPIIRAHIMERLGILSEDDLITGHDLDAITWIGMDPSSVTPGSYKGYFNNRVFNSLDDVFEDLKEMKNLSYVNFAGAILPDFVDINRFEGITTFEYSFADCRTIRSISVNKHLASSVRMFSGCTSLNEINLGDEFGSNDASYMFSGCIGVNLFSIDKDSSRISASGEIFHNGFIATLKLTGEGDVKGRLFYDAVKVASCLDMSNLTRPELIEIREEHTPNVTKLMLNDTDVEVVDLSLETFFFPNVVDLEIKNTKKIKDIKVTAEYFEKIALQGSVLVDYKVYVDSHVPLLKSTTGLSYNGLTINGEDASNQVVEDIKNGTYLFRENSDIEILGGVLDGYTVEYSYYEVISEDGSSIEGIFPDATLAEYIRIKTGKSSTADKIFQEDLDAIELFGYTGSDVPENVPQIESSYFNGKVVNSWVGMKYIRNAKYFTSRGVLGNADYINLGNCTLLESLTGAFSGNSVIAEVKLPSTMNELRFANNAFQDCTSLEKFSMPRNANKLESISNIFRGCASLSSITMPVSTPVLEDLPYAFYNCAQLTNVSLAAATEAVTLESAFHGCTAITSVQLPESMPNLRSMNSTFRSCTSLTNMNLRAIEMPLLENLEGTFRYCSNLENVLLPIETPFVSTMSNLFAHCGALNSVDLPRNMNSVTTLNGLFSQCSNITKIELPNLPQVTTMAGIADGCSNLVEINIPAIIPNLTTPHAEILLEKPNAKVKYHANELITAYEQLSLKLKQVRGLDFSGLTNIGDIEVSEGDVDNEAIREVNVNGTKVSDLDFITGSGKVASRLEVLKADGTTELKKLRIPQTVTSLTLNGSGILNVETLHDTVPSILLEVNGVKYTRLSFNGIELTADEVSQVKAGTKKFGQGTIMILDGYLTGKVVAITILDGIPEEGMMISEIFPDPVVAEVIRIHISKETVDSVITQANLDTIRMFGYTGSSIPTTSTPSSSYCLFNGKTISDLTGLKLLKNVEYFTFRGASFTGGTIDLSHMNDWSLKSLNSSFYGCSNLTSIDLSGLNTSNITSMYSVFSYCSNLTSLDLSNFDTSNVTTMSYMFESCSGLTSLDLSNFDTSKVTNTVGLFYFCTKLTSLDVSNWDTSNVTSMSSMFNSCSRLTSLDLSNFDTSNVTSMSSMFNSCSNLTSLDLSNFNTSKVTSMSNMFNSCSNLTSLDLSNFDTSNVTSIGNMFYSCSKLTSLIFPPLLPKVTTTLSNTFLDMAGRTITYAADKNVMTKSDIAYHNSDGTPQYTESVLSYANLPQVWTELPSEGAKISTAFPDASIAEVVRDHLNKPSVDDVIYQSDLDTIKYFGWKRTSLPPWAPSSSESLLSGKTITDLTGMNLLKNLEYFTFAFALFEDGVVNLDPLKNLNNLKNLLGSFMNSNLTSISLSGLKLQDVDNIEKIFYSCRELTSISFKDLSMPALIKMDFAFSGCVTLDSVNLEGADFTSVTSIYGLYSNCFELEDIDMSSFKNSKLTSIGFVFSFARNIKIIDLSMLDLSEVTEISAITQACGADIILPPYMPKVTTSSSFTHLNSNRTITYSYDERIKSKADIVFHNEDGTPQMTYPTHNYDNLPQVWTEVPSSGVKISQAFPDPVVAEEIRRKLNKSSIDDVIYQSNLDSITIFGQDYLPSTSSYSVNSSRFAGKTISTLVGLQLLKNVRYFAFGEMLNETIDLSPMQNWENLETLGCSFYNCGNLTEVNIEVLNTSKVTNMGNMFRGCGKLTSLDLSNFNTSSSKFLHCMFNNCYALTSLDLSNWNTSNATSIDNMFYSCSNLTSLDVSNWDTSKVTSIGGLFQFCGKLTSLDLSSFDTSNVTSMYSMFSYCSNLTSLDVSNFDTSNVTNMESMFSNCYNLTSLDLSNFDTSKVTSMERMFYSCSYLTSLDLSSFDTSNVTSIDNMFSYCSNLTSLDLSGWNTSNVTNMNYTFGSCSKLTSLIFPPLLPKVTTTLSSSYLDMAGRTITYASDDSITSKSQIKYHSEDGIPEYTLSKLDYSRLSNLPGIISELFPDPVVAEVIRIHLGKTSINSEVTNAELDTIKMFGYTGSSIPTTSSPGSSYCLFNGKTISDLTGLELLKSVEFFTFRGASFTGGTIDLSPMNGWGKLNSLNGSFYGCSNLTSLDVNNLNTSNVTNINYMFYNCSGLTSLDLSNFDTSKVTSMNYMFQSCSKLTSLDLSNFDTSNVTSMYSMFQSCSRLTSLDVSNFNTSKVTNTVCMFQSCSGLTSLDVSNFNTSNVTSMSYMFQSCSGLTSLDLSNFDTSKVMYMTYMFHSCSKLTSLDLSSFNTSNVTDMSYMFGSCSGLTYFDVSNWDTSKVTTMNSMFYYCSGSTSLDLSNWDTSKVTNMSYMLYSCSKLTSLDLSNWNTSNVTSMDSMFYSCSSLTSLSLPKKMPMLSNLEQAFSNCAKMTLITMPALLPSLTTSISSTYIESSTRTYIYYADDSITDLGQITIHPNTGTKDYSNLSNVLSLLSVMDVTLATYLANKVGISIDGLLDSAKFDSVKEILDPPNSVYDFSGLKYCRNLERISFKGNVNYRFISLRDVTHIKSLKESFAGCVNLEVLELPISINNIEEFTDMISGCDKLSLISISDSYITSKLSELFKEIDKPGIEISMYNILENFYDVFDVYKIRNADVTVHGDFREMDKSFYMCETLSRAVSAKLQSESEEITVSEIESVDELLIDDKIYKPTSLILFKGLNRVVFENPDVVTLDLRFAKNISEVVINNSGSLEELLLPIHNTSNQEIDVTINGECNLREVFANKKLNLAYEGFNKIL